MQGLMMNDNDASWFMLNHNGLREWLSIIKMVIVQTATSMFDYQRLDMAESQKPVPQLWTYNKWIENASLLGRELLPRFLAG